MEIDIFEHRKQELTTYITKISEPSSNDSIIARNYMKLGILFREQEMYEEAIQVFSMAIMHAEKGDVRTIKSSSTHYIGTCYRRQELWELSMQWNTKALELGQLAPGYLMLGSSYNEIGMTYYGMGDYQRSLEYQFRSLEQKKKDSLVSRELAWATTEIARSYLALESIDSAKFYGELSLELVSGFDTITNDNGEEEIIPFYHPKERRNAQEVLRKVYEELGDYEAAHESNKEYHMIKDILGSSKIAELLVSTSMKNNFLQKEQLKKKEDAHEKRQQELILIGAGVLGILLVGFILFITNRLKLTRKQNRIIEEQKEIVEEAHKEITDSINYAERIQRSFLATEELLNAHLGEHFVYFNPKEAVSGDFYWAGLLSNGNFAVSCADSTGHGVPGAIMSILNISSIEKAVEMELSKPSEIFNETRRLIIERLKKDGSPEGGKDGMDASLIAFNPEKTKMQYVAAHNPIWIIREGKLIDMKAEKMPVGKHDHDHIPFEGGVFDLQKGDIIYTITDGFQDQFGGEKGKKFKVKPMKRMLVEISDLSMTEQREKISETFEQWKGALEQVDDVCIVGVRV